MGKKGGVLDRAESGAPKRLWLNLFSLWSHEPPGVNIMDGQIVEIRIKRPKMPGGDVLTIVKLEQDGRRYVAFSAGEDAAESLAGALQRAKEAALKWKADEYTQLGLPGPEGRS